MQDHIKIVFMGTPIFSCRVLQALFNNVNVDVLAVYTQPDRPAGRGRKITPSAVKELAINQNSAVIIRQPVKINAEEIEFLKNLKPDVVFVVAYGLLLPQAWLDVPRLGCVNSHASLLPSWRGAAPIQRAILAGNKKTGICLMQMDAGLDTGDVIYQTEIEIGKQDNAGIISAQLAEISAELTNKYIANIANLPTPTPQPISGASYAHKFKTADMRINWQLSSEEIINTIRAFSPVPGAWTTIGNKRVKIFTAKIKNTDDITKSVGTILIENNQLLVKTIDNRFITIEEIQFAGERKKNIQQLMLSHKLFFKENPFLD